MKVVKFGGSSLASATQFKKVHDIVLEDTDRHYVVPSAPGKRNKEDTKVTDLLILAYSHHNKDDFEEIYDRIKERYNEIITELGLDVSLEEDFKEIKEEIKKNAGTQFDPKITNVFLKLMDDGSLFNLEPKLFRFKKIQLINLYPMLYRRLKIRKKQRTTTILQAFLYVV